MRINKSTDAIDVDHYWPRPTKRPTHVLVQVMTRHAGREEWKFISLTPREARKVIAALENALRTIDPDGDTDG